MMNTVDLVVPCYNESEVLHLFFEETSKVTDSIAGYTFNYIFVDDGSHDNTFELILELSKKNDNVKYISFSRNFGKEAGMYAGLLHSTGDYVIIVNADKIKVTGKKLDQKIYYHHSDYVGGMRETTLREMLAKHPERVLEFAVKGMLPKGPLGRQMYKKLFVYATPDHKHEAQKPEVLTF